MCCPICQDRGLSNIHLKINLRHYEKKKEGKGKERARERNPRLALGLVCFPVDQGFSDGQAGLVRFNITKAIPLFY